MVLPEAPRKHRRSLTGESPETMKEIRLLALDIDGTILTREKRLTNRTRAAIEAAVDAGIAVSLVTGRPFCGIPEELLSLKGLGYVISSNGAVTTDLKLSRILRNANLDPETALEIISIPRTHALVYAVFMDGMGFSEPEPFERHLGMIDNPGLETYVRGSRRITRNLEEDIREARNGVENIWFIARDRQERDALNRQICEKWNVRTVLTEKTDLEIGCLQADKGMALSELAGLLGIGKQEILAIGDSGNDIGMLRAAGTAVAMGNAEEGIKKIADVIAGSNSEDGAAEVIEAVLRKDETIYHTGNRKACHGVF